MGSGYRTLRSLLVVFLLVGVSAFNLASQYSPTRIKVLSADFHSLADANPVPKNCDLTNFDAYCNESKNATGENIMRVQDSDGKSFVITCTVDSRCPSALRCKWEKRTKPGGGKTESRYGSRIRTVRTARGSIDWRAMVRL